MRVSDFDFNLPEELIAQEPMAERTASRLLVVDGASGELADRQFTDVLDLIAPGDLLVFNNTRVIPARLFGQKESGGKLEVLVERPLDEQRVLAHVRASKSPKPGSQLMLGSDKGEGFSAEVIARHDALFELRFDGEVFSLLESYGHMPLPPYIERADKEEDQERYQTVYAKEKGAVAAPTAGLHFDEPLLERLKAKGVNLAYVTLHVGAGTFQPVRVDHVHEHKMHSESIVVSEETAAQIRETRARGNRVIAVGTTSLRSLESAAQQSSDPQQLDAFSGDTDIFIYPGYQFQVVDALITNFHLPQSTLMMLVSAFAGMQTIKQAYQHAIDERYRFFSYGDAMFLKPASESLAARVPSSRTPD